MSATTVAWLLATALAIALVVLAVVVTRLRRTRAALAEIEDDTVELQAVPETPRAMHTAGVVMSKVVEAATIAREQGVGQMLVAGMEDFSRWATEQRSAIGRVADSDGTVTIFFSDIEGSTALNSALGDTRWVRVLAAHDELVETYVERYRGLVVKTQGDGYMVVFTTPSLALDAALGIQRALGAQWNRSRHLRRTPIRVRIGLHTGTAIERGGDYFGQNVAIAARVAAEAQGGEILVTSEIADEYADRYTFTSVGAVQLRGVDGDHELWHVEGRAPAGA